MAYQLPASPKLPEVFDFSNLSYENRRDDFFERIVDCKPFEVQSGFACRFGDLADSLTGRQAVWRSLDLACDILVEMKDVPGSFPILVEVELVEPFCCLPSSGTSNPPVSQEQIVSYLKDHENSVDVVELFPVHDDQGDLDDGAFAIEQTRFFFDYIWRCSDEDDCGDYYFVMRHLEPRLKLYYDVRNKKVSAGLIKKYQETITEYQAKRRLLQQKQALLESDDDDDYSDEDDDSSEEDSDPVTLQREEHSDEDNCVGKENKLDSDNSTRSEKSGKDACVTKAKDGDSETVDNKDSDSVEDSDNVKDSDRKMKSMEMDEMALVEIAGLWDDITHLQRGLEIMENPVMRYLTDKPSSSRKRKWVRSSVVEIRHTRQHNEPVTHVVAKKITTSMIKGLQLPVDTAIVTHTSPALALAGCYDNDTILIFPGTYRGRGFNKLAQSVTIQGIGSPGSVVIVCKLREKLDCYHPFVSSCADNLTIRNLTFVDESPRPENLFIGPGEDDLSFGGIVQVRCGTTSLIHCRFKCCSTGIEVWHCGLNMHNCEVSGAQGPGVTMYMESKVLMKSCHIHDCGKKAPATAEEMCGVLIMSRDMLTNKRAKSKMSVTIQDCRIQRNVGPAILLMIHSQKEQQEAKAVDLDDLCTLTCRDLRVTGNDISANGQGEAMVFVKKI